MLLYHSLLFPALQEKAVKRVPHAQVRIFPTLYALSKNGNIRYYRIVVKHFSDYSKITTYKAAKEGAKETSDSYIYTEGVNIGKANETTFQEQAENEAASMYRRCLDSGFKANKPTSNQNTDANGFIKPMLASPDASKIVFPCLMQPKFDGVRCLSGEHDGEIHIVSRRGKEYNIPHLAKFLDSRRELLPLDGELYDHHITFQEIISAVKKVSDLTKKIKYVVYDRPIQGNFEERWNSLSKFPIFGEETDSPIVLSPTVIVHSMEEAKEFHDKFVAQGFEGGILRNLKGDYAFGFRSKDLAKVKVFDEEEFRIIDVLEATGRDAGTAIFECETKDGNTFTVKPQGTKEVRSGYFEDRENLIGLMCTVQYQGYTDEGKPRFPSAKTIRDYE